MNIYIDMDGTIVNFMKGFQKACNHLLTEDEWVKGEYSLKEVMGSHFAPGVMNSVRFWSTLEPYPFASTMIEFCKQVGEVWLITDCQSNPIVYSGKMVWLREWMPEFAERVIVSGDRRWIHPSDLLIDDSDSHTLGYLVPRVWNSAHPLAKHNGGGFLDYSWSLDLEALSKVLIAKAFPPATWIPQGLEGTNSALENGEVR